jgi:hypothetical protein
MLKSYKVEIKEFPIEVDNNPSLMSDMQVTCKMIMLIAQESEAFRGRFCSLANLISSVGGVIDFGKLELENDWTIFVNKIIIKIPEKYFDIVSQHPDVVSINPL